MLRREQLSTEMSRAALLSNSASPVWNRAAAPAIAGGCFVVGLFIGEPVATTGLTWVRDNMIPAFMELYASGIPFCG